MIKLKHFKVSVVAQYFGYSFNVFVFVKKNNTVALVTFLDDNVLINAEII